MNNWKPIRNGSRAGTACFSNLAQAIRFVLVFMLTVLYFTTFSGNPPGRGVLSDAPAKIIYETDMCADVDDVGGLAILHAFANQGKAEILAVCFNEVHPSGAAAIDAINTWYKRGDIPVGVYKGYLANPDNSAYLDYVTNFPHDLESTSAPSALDVYRQVLAAQPDSSVTIISVGFLNNINNLLVNEPDLVARKVKELVVMGGIHNDGFNLSRHNLVSVSENVIRHWPTPIFFSQAGGDILTGDNLQNAPDENPVREAYYRYFGGAYNARPSWDPMAVLYAVMNSSYYFYVVSKGTGTLNNGYTWQMQEGFRSYLVPRLSNSTYENIIENLLEQRPIGAYFSASVQQGWGPLSVEFDASGSVVEAGRTIQQFLWDFGDGTHGEGQQITHTFIDPGEYVVSLVTVDDLGDSLQFSSAINIYNPIFSSTYFYGDARNYLRNQENLWSTELDDNDIRYCLSNGKRETGIALAGFSFVKDSLYSDFNLQLTVRTGEDLSQNKYANYSIIFGYKDDQNYNQLLIKTTTSQLISVTNGQRTYLSWTSDPGVPDDRYHRLTMNLESSRLAVWLDDRLFLSITSSKLLTTGRIGFGSDKYSVLFDDIQIDRAITKVRIRPGHSLPLNLEVSQNYPNPFNPRTRIEFSLPRAGRVLLEIFDIHGRRIRTLLDGWLSQGRYNIDWDGRNESGQPVASGIYLARFKFAKHVRTVKMHVIR